ncbi:hypothetical protein ACTFIW_003412 [Dictyostelium discoideum]
MDIECDIRKINKLNYNNENEIYKLKKLNHPSIIKHYDIDEEKSEKNVIIYQESINGGISIDKFDNNNFFSQEVIREICEQILLALRFMDNHQIVHRDLNCSNVIIFPETLTIKIIDFGVTKTNFLNQDYQSPEVLKSNNYTHKSDIWSFGFILLKMIDKSLNNIPDDLPTEQFDFLHSCLATNLSDRLDAQTLLHHPFIINKPILRFSKSMKLISSPKKQFELVNKTEHEIILLTNGTSETFYLNKNESCKIKISTIDLYIGVRFDDGAILSSPRPTKLIEQEGTDINSFIIDQSCLMAHNITFPNISFFESISEII